MKEEAVVAFVALVQIYNSALIAGGGGGDADGKEREEYNN